MSGTGTQRHVIDRARPRGACLWLFAAMLAWSLPTSARATETKSFVLSYFYPANYYGDDTCPEGLNPLSDVFFKRDLKILGLPQAEVNAMFDKDYKIQNGDPTTRWVTVVATRGNGRDNVYLHPTTVPDAHLKPAVGRFAYGFNLDGKGAASPNSYEDPDTREKGINNQLFRTIGCIQVYKGYPPPQPPLEAEYRWDVSRAVMGAWLISVSGNDLSHDGDVTVRFETSLDPVIVQDANAHIQSDMTYRLAGHPASVNVLRGKIRSGVIYTEPARIRMQCSSYIQPVYDFLEARMRLRIKPDGNLEGVLGGYQPWYDVYWSHAKVGYVDERGFGVDAPALFYALRRYADAYPDPLTHRNTAISSAYRVEAVPAFIARMDDASAVHPAVATEAAQRQGPSWLCTTLGMCPQSQSFFTRVFAPAEPQAAAAPPIARRLTSDQYRRVIADVFGPTIKVEGRFEPGLREQGLFALGTGRVGVTATGMEQFDAMAHGIAQQVAGSAHRRTLVPCTPALDTAPDDACAAQFFARTGAVLYRRPLSQNELRQAVAVAHAASTILKSFYDGLEMSLAGMLESPQFLFRTELGEPESAHPGAYRLDAYSKASQLSFFLWNSAPDAQLTAAAASGRLETQSGLDLEVDRMLTSPRLEAGVRAFFVDMLQFDLFDTLAKDAKIYPKWTFKVSQDAQEQTLRTIVDLLLTQHGDYRDLFTTRSTFLTATLASIYRVPIPQNAAPWQPYEFPAGDPRAAGILAQASFVALHSHEGSSSPTLRGKALRELLLCEPVPAPPGNVNLTGAQDTHNPHYKTMRERLTAHRTEPTCAGCHKLMDPIGLALENFDSDGEYRLSENGTALDTSGELDGIPFKDAAGLGRAMHDNPATGACLVRRLYSYATGRAPARHDLPWIRYLERSFVADGYRLPELMRRIATSENLYRVGPPATELVAHAGSIGENAR